MSILDAVRDVAMMPEGPRPGADTSLVVRGTLVGYDETRSLATVSMWGGDGVQVPAVADVDWSAVLDRADGDGSPAAVYILRDAAAGRAVACLRPVVSPPPPPATGTVVAVSAAGLTVNVAGREYLAMTVVSYASPSPGDTVVLTWVDRETPIAIGEEGTPPSALPPSTPAAPSLSRSGGTVTVRWVRAAGTTDTDVRWSADGGSSWSYRSGLTGTSTSLSIAPGQTLTVQVQAGNAAGESAWSLSSTVTRPQDTLVTRTTVVSPAGSGTYRYSRAAWDRWNTGRYGGSSTLWQGDGYGSGALKGLATYGSRVTNLGAVEITKIEVRIRGAGSPGPTGYTVTLEGSPHGSRPGGAPSSSGANASTTLSGASGTDWLTLPSGTYEDWRTGDIRGLCTIGSDYLGIRGTSAADGMQLRITYRRRA